MGFPLALELHPEKKMDFFFMLKEITFKNGAEFVQEHHLLTERPPAFGKAEMMAITPGADFAQAVVALVITVLGRINQQKVPLFQSPIRNRSRKAVGVRIADGRSTDGRLPSP